MTKEIKVCMGSACFAKGNQENLAYIQQYIDDNNLDTEVTIIGSLCENKCSEGPRIIVDGTEYTKVTQDQLSQILRS